MDASCAAWRESGSTTRIRDMAMFGACRRRGPRRRRPSGRAVRFPSRECGTSAWPTRPRGALAHRVRDRVRRHAADPFAHANVRKRDERHQQHKTRRRQNQISKPHVLDAWQLPFRAADIEKMRTAGSAPHKTSCCRYEAAAALVQARAASTREAVPPRNTHLPTISAARFTDLNERVPFRDQRRSLRHRACSRETLGEQRVNRASSIAARGHGTPVARIRHRRRGHAAA